MESVQKHAGVTPDQALALTPKVSVALGHFITQVTSASSEEEIFSTLAQNLKELIPNDRASVTLLNDTEDELDIFSLHGVAGVMPVGKSLPLETTFTGWAVLKQTGQLHRVDSDAETLDGQLLYREGMRCIVNAPLIVNGKAIGAINSASLQPDGFDAQSLELLLLISRLVSTNLERQRLLEERKKTEAKYRFYATQLEILNKLAQRLSTVMSMSETLRICEETIQSVIPSQRVSYALYQPESHSFEVTVLSGQDVLNSPQLPAAGSALERVLTEQVPCYFPDLSESPHPEHRKLYENGLISAWMVPVRIEGKAIAVLNAASNGSGDNDSKLAEVLGMLGAILGSALERLKAHEKLVHQVNHDPVTGLPNRRKLYEQINQRINSKSPEILSVLFIDLDRFKAVNDSLGHQAGDELLRMVGYRIQQVLPKKHLVARVGGDEFIVLMDDEEDARHSKEAAQQIIQRLSQPFSIAGTSIEIGATIGISLSTGEIFETEEMIKAADLAMYEAKAAGRNTFRIDRSKRQLSQCLASAAE